MPRLVSILASVVMLLALGSSAASADDEGDARKRALALRVMEVTGATAQGDQVAAGLLAQMRPGYPSVPDEVWSELQSTFALSEIIALSIPIYMRNFDEQELSELVAFYESPLGRKVIQRMPVVMQESTVAFNRWNLAKYGEVMQKLQDKGYSPVPEFAEALQQLGVPVPAQP